MSNNYKMETKTCNCCEEEKPLENFYYREKEDRYEARCTPCSSKIVKEKRQKNPDMKKKNNNSSRQHYQKNKAIMNKQSREYHEKHKEEISKKMKIYYDSHKEEAKQKALDKRKENKKKAESGTLKKPNIKSKKCSKCGEKKDIIKFSYYKAKNSYDSSCKDCNALRERQRRALIKKNGGPKKKVVRKPLTVQQKIRHNLRKRLNGLVKRRVKKNMYSDLLGCQLTFLHKWFEYIFELDKHLNMSWDNYGDVWHIDHVTPCASFDLKIKENQEKCFHWTNLCPVLADYNLEKGDKIIQEDIDKQQSRVENFKIKMQNP